MRTHRWQRYIGVLCLVGMVLVHAGPVVAAHAGQDGSTTGLPVARAILIGGGAALLLLVVGAVWVLIRDRGKPSSALFLLIGLAMLLSGLVCVTGGLVFSQAGAG